MRLKLLAHTPDVETLIAVSMLTTTSGAKPSTLYQRLKAKPGKVSEVVGRAETQHGNILEHNRFTWLVEASEPEVLAVLENSRFINTTRLGGGRWVLSCNLRAAVEYSKLHGDEFSRLVAESIVGVEPGLRRFFKGVMG